MPKALEKWVGTKLSHKDMFMAFDANSSDHQKLTYPEFLNALESVIC